MKYILYILLLILIASCDMHKQFHTACLTDEEVVFKDVDMLKNLKYVPNQDFITGLSTDSTLLCRFESVKDKKSMFNIYKSTDFGETWACLISFEKYKVFRSLKCGSEIPTVNIFLEDNKKLFYIGDYDCWTVDVEEFNKSRNFKLFDKFSYSNHNVRKVYSNRDTIICFNFKNHEISVDSGATWRNLYPEYNDIQSNIGYLFTSFVTPYTVVNIYHEGVMYSEDLGETWHKSESFSKSLDSFFNSHRAIVLDLKKISTGEYCLYVYYDEKNPDGNKYSGHVYRFFTSKNGIKWDEIQTNVCEEENTSDKKQAPFLIDKIGNNKFVFRIDDQEYPIRLITKHHTYRLPFPTGNIEYTKSGYWYYYDDKKHNFCRRKIVLK